MKYIILTIITLVSCATNSYASKFNFSNYSINISYLLASEKIDSLPYAALYFYRPFIPKLSAPLKKVKIFINDTLKCKLEANTYVAIKIFNIRRLTISIDEKGKSDIPIDIEFGKKYFFECNVVYGLLFGKPTIKVVTKEIAEKELGSTIND